MVSFEKSQPIENHRITFVHAGSLDVISHEEYADIKQEYGHEALSFHRVDLHHELVALATAQDQAKNAGARLSLHSGIQVVAIDCEKGSLKLESGETIENDLLVIADGAHVSQPFAIPSTPSNYVKSDLFSQFTGSPDPIARIGRSLYRILLDRDQVLADPKTAHLFTSPPSSLNGFIGGLDPVENTLIITYPCRSKAPTLNIAIVHDTKISPKSADSKADQTWQVPASIEEVLETIHNFHPDFKALISMSKEDEIKIHHGMSRPPLKSFVRGRTVLIGDAAHLMLPTHAAGASIAIESAGVLGVLMRGIQEDTPTSVIKDKLKIFDAQRVPRCTTTQILSNEGFMAQARPEVVQQIHEQGYHDWLPGPTAGTWDKEFRHWYFGYDARAEAEKALLKSKS